MNDELVATIAAAVHSALDEPLPTDAKHRDDNWGRCSGCLVMEDILPIISQAVGEARLEEARDWMVVVEYASTPRGKRRSVKEGHQRIAALEAALHQPAEKGASNG